MLLAPMHSSTGAAATVMRRLLDDGFIDHVMFQDLDQSMAGGGGPACLRLRLPLTPGELATLAPGVLLDETKLQRLEAWVDQYYRDELAPADLADPLLLRETQEALDTLTQLLELGALYPFQCDSLSPRARFRGEGSSGLRSVLINDKIGLQTGTTGFDRERWTRTASRGCHKPR